MKKGAEVITDPRTAEILVDPMRREMIRLLAQHSMTENELSKQLGLSEPAVGHHLKILMNAGLIRIARKEVEEHGIVQKFYETTATAYFVDSRKMPLEIDRYFMPAALERARGMIAMAGLTAGRSRVISTADLEEFASATSLAVVKVAPKYSRHIPGGREEMIIRVYRDALNLLLGKPELVPENVRTLLSASQKSVYRA